VLTSSDGVRTHTEVAQYGLLQWQSLAAILSTSMRQVSEWHDFNPTDPSTYPKVDGPIQVKFYSGRIEEGHYFGSFTTSSLLGSSAIVSWRYIRDKTISS
jgi:hypothetical protein